MDQVWTSLRGPTRGRFPGVRPGALEADLLSALDRREIEVLFQPQFACVSGAVTGAEALARWQHPSLGEIGARDLFAIAERAALVAPLSRHVVARALEDAATWPHNLMLSLNITPEELGDPRFAADFAALIGQSAIAPQRLMLEITEDLLLRNLGQAASALKALRGLGFRTALDDFGAGFCNFRYLRELPLDALKLDKAMVETSALIQSMIEGRKDAGFAADVGHAALLNMVRGLSQLGGQPQKRLDRHHRRSAQ